MPFGTYLGVTREEDLRSPITLLYVISTMTLRLPNREKLLSWLERLTPRLPHLKEIRLRLEINQRLRQKQHFAFSNTF
jgi:hypothetical protein